MTPQRYFITIFLALVGATVLTENHVDAQAPEAQPDDDAVTRDVPASLEEGPSISDEVFARMAENPVSGVTRLPVLNSALFGIPPSDRVGDALVLAPTIPALFNGGWSLITRTTIPAVVTVPFASDAAPPSTGRTTGFGDIGLEVLGHKMLRGKKGQFYDVSLGTFVGFPSASDDFLGTGRWRLGPGLALGISARKWVTVLIARNEWSVGNGSDRADVNQLSMQYFLFYNLPKLFYLVYEPIITANWNAQPGDRWTLPVGLGFGRHIRLPKRPRLALTTRYSGFYNAVQTDRGAKWQLLATLVFWKPNPAVFNTK
ncbi:MAG: hypothetical protein WCF10_11125 [Polyangiales bacterium]